MTFIPFRHKPQIAPLLGAVAALGAFTLNAPQANAYFDPYFGSGGVVRVQPGYFDSFSMAYGLAIDSNKRLVVAGRSSAGNGDDVTLVCWNSSGNLDSNFGNAGIARVDASRNGSADGAYAVGIDGSGRIVGAGYAYLNGMGDMTATRFTSNGQLDSSFGTNGVARINASTSANGDDTARDVIVLSSGASVMAGSSTQSTTSGNRTRATLAALDANGQLDTSFGVAGIAQFDASGVGGNSSITKVRLGNNKWFVAGQYAGATGGVTWAKTFLARLNLDGSLDTSFGTGGVVRLELPVAYAAVSGLVVNGDAIYLAGTLNDSANISTGGIGSFVFKLDSNGSPAAGFGENGRALFTYNVSPGANKFAANSLALDNRGRVLLGGASSSSALFPTRAVGWAMARLGTDGVPDSSLPDGFITLPGSNGTVAQAIALDTNRIYLAGYDMASAASWFAAGALDPTTFDLSVSATGASGPEKELAQNGGLPFTISLSSAINTPVKVQYKTSDGTALAGNDYTAQSGEVTIPAGQRSVEVRIPVRDELKAERDEQFYLVLTGSSLGVVNNGSNGTGASGVIVDDDTPVAENSAYTTSFNTPFDGNMIASDPAGLPLTYIANPPAHGTLTVNASTGAFTYTPEAGFAGRDAFSFRVHNGSAYSNFGNVSILVREQPSLVVTTLQDVEADDSQTSLREAVRYAFPGTSGESKTITFAPGLNGNLVLKSSISFDYGLSIQGPGASQISIVSGFNGSLFEIGDPTWATNPTSDQVEISGLQFNGGKGYTGGAIYARVADVRVSECIFTENTASYGGAICANGPLSVRNCYFANNTATQAGGAIEGAGITATQCTFWGNAAPQGGAIYSTDFDLNFCTLTANKAVVGTTNDTNQPIASAGGGIYPAGPSGVPAILNNCIVTGNTSVGSYPDIYTGSGRYIGGSYNLIGVNAGLDPAGPNPNGAILKTVALLPGSPAIDAGAPAFDTASLPYDQRGAGFPRKIGARVDIGAFEYRVNSAPVLPDSLFTFQQGQSINNVRLQGTDADGDPVTYSRNSSLPDGIGIDSEGRFYGTPTTLTSPEGWGTTVTLTDTLGAKTTGQITIYVTNTSKPVLLVATPFNDQRMLISAFKAGSITGKASDAEGIASVTMKLTRLRNGVVQIWNGSSFTTASATVPATLSGDAHGVTWKVDKQFPAGNQLDDGQYILVMYATDVLGNSTNVTTRFTLYSSDTEKPVTQIFSPTLNQKILISQFGTATVMGNATDNLGVAAVKVRLSRKRDGVNYYWNGSAFTNSAVFLNAKLLSPNTPSTQWFISNQTPPTSALDSGLYQVEAYAVDVAGNKGVTIVRPFTLGSDFEAPRVTITAPTASQRISLSAFGAGTINGTGTDNLGVTVVKLKLQRTRGGLTTYWNGTAFTPTSATVDATLSNTGTWSLSSNVPTPATGLDTGVYTLYATAYDAAGNFRTSASRSFTLTAPIAAPAADSSSAGKS